MNKIIFFLLVIIFASPALLISKDADSLYYELKPVILIPDGPIRIIDTSKYFEGYMIFKIYKNNNPKIYSTTSEVYQCEIFFLENLNMFSKKYFYNNVTTYYQIYAGKDENEFVYDSSRLSKDYLEEINSKDFKLFKKFIYEYISKPNDDTSKEFLRNRLKTNIFEIPGVNFYKMNNKNDIGYFIFKVSFYTAVLEYNCFYKKVVNNSESEYKNVYQKNVSFFIPLSKVIQFEPAALVSIPKKFSISEWYPKNLFNK